MELVWKILALFERKFKKMFFSFDQRFEVILLHREGMVVSGECRKIPLHNNLISKHIFQKGFYPSLLSKKFFLLQY